jgi:hypothetical protein
MTNIKRLQQLAGINETKIAPKSLEHYTNKFIDDNFDEFSSLDGDVMHYKVNDLDKKIVNFVKKISINPYAYHKYRNIAIYYVPREDEIWVEDMSMFETKIAPKPSYYAIVNYGWNNIPDNPAYYITASTKPEMINRLNIAYQTLTNSRNLYSIDDMDENNYMRNAYIEDDWAVVTANKDYFDNIMARYPTRPQQFKIK